MSSIIEKIFGVYFIILIILGTIGNCIGFCICVRKRLQTITFFIFLSFIYIADTMALYLWCLNHFLEVFWNFRIEDLNVWTCRFGFFIQQFSLHWSSWLLVALTLDRYLSVKIKTWWIVYFKSIQAVLASCIIGMILIILNSHLLVLNGSLVSDHGEIKVDCYGKIDIMNDVNWIFIWKIV